MSARQGEQLAKRGGVDRDDTFTPFLSASESPADSTGWSDDSEYAAILGSTRVQVVDVYKARPAVEVDGNYCSAKWLPGHRVFVLNNPTSVNGIAHLELIRVPDRERLVVGLHTESPDGCPIASGGQSEYQVLGACTTRPEPRAPDGLVLTRPSETLVAGFLAPARVGTAPSW